MYLSIGHPKTRLTPALVPGSLLNKNTQGVGTFLNMARYCLSALTTHKLQKSASLSKTLYIYYNYTVCLVKLKLMKFLYWVSLTRLGGYCEMLLPSHVVV